MAKLAQAAADAKGGDEARLSGWETQFLSEVGRRLQTYGSAFANLAKGRADEALSNLQAVKLKEIEAKAKGKTRRGLTRKKKSRRSAAPRRQAMKD